MTGPTRILLTPFEVIGCPKAAMRSPTKESIFSRGLDENVTRLRIGHIFFSTRLVEKVGGKLSIYGKAITNGANEIHGTLLLKLYCSWPPFQANQILKLP